MAWLLRPPPGLILEPGEVLTAYELVIEWIAYLGERRYDAFLSIGVAAALYDMLWTPCLWLLPIELDAASLAVGFCIDGAHLCAVLLNCLVWGWSHARLRIFVDSVSCLPWELIGLWSDERRPAMWARSMVKVCTQP